MGICLCLVILYFNLPKRIAIPAQCHHKIGIICITVFCDYFHSPLKHCILFENLTNRRNCIRTPHQFKTYIRTPHLELLFQSRHSSASLYFVTIFTHPLKIIFCLKTLPFAVNALKCLTNSKM